MSTYFYTFARRVLSDYYTMMRDDGLDEIRAVVEQRIKDRGLVPAVVSRQATGNPDVVRKFINEHTTVRADRLKKLAEELGLEFYIGPPRPSISADIQYPLPTAPSALLEAREPEEAYFVQSFEAGRSPEGSVGLRLDFDNLGTLVSLLTPAQAKDLADRLTYQALQIEDRNREGPEQKSA